MKMLISFVVPIFNIEGYVENCVNSIIRQGGDDFEVILVDDGSTDNSGILCDDLVKRDKRVRCYHKENGGLSDARNYGIEKANGEYIAFVDGDDFLGEKSVEKISKIIRQRPDVEVIFMKGWKYFDSKKLIPLDDESNKAKINGKTKKEVLEYLSSLSKFPASACTKVVKRELILSNNLFFAYGILSEDVDWTIRLLQKASSFWYCDYDYYFYRQNRKGSISNSVNCRHLQDLLAIIRKHSINKDGEFSQNFFSFLAYELAVVIFLYSSVPAGDQKRAIEREIGELSWLLGFNKTMRIGTIDVIYRKLGLTCTSYLLRTVKFILSGVRKCNGHLPLRVRG